MKIDKITNNCCGCRLCENICPQKCISFELNNEGFVYPVIGNNCIGCGVCKLECPSNSNNASTPQSGYMAFSRKTDDRKNGSSGGIFGLLAKEVIRESGIVFGAAFDENLDLISKSAETEDELYPLLKSKYLQCNTTGMYKRIKDELETGRKVLVCNTPCNIAALKNYLGRDFENLVLIDFVCHGVPSQDFFNKCIDWHEKTKNIKVLYYSFREKTKNPPTPHLYKIIYRKNKKFIEQTALYLKDPFYLAFQKRISLRDSCYNCLYAKKDRVSDITLGDFHDIEKFTQKYDRMQGVSMVLLNSDKGIDIFNKISKKLIVERFDTNILVENNECLNSPTVRPNKRIDFFQKINDLGIDYVIDKELNRKKEWKKELYYNMPAFARKLLKKIVIGE